jgi:glucose-1-phosphate cytidylyltransferase
MKVVLLAGGLGSRLSEETELKPKPMVEIGGYPILWHIMKHYAQYDMRDFYVALGYRGDAIKRFFLDYYELSGNMTLDLIKDHVERTDRDFHEWVVHLCDTGQDTMTGGRVKRLASHLQDETFMVTYGDGVCNLSLRELLAFHRSHGRIATVTAVRPPARFGGLEFDGDRVVRFIEKPQVGEGWINGGFLVFEPRVFDYLEGDHSSLEANALERLAADGELCAYRHDGFWQCMDTMRDKKLLETLWASGDAPWRTWVDK